MEAHFNCDSFTHIVSRDYSHSSSDVIFPCSLLLSVFQEQNIVGNSTFLWPAALEGVLGRVGLEEAGQKKQRQNSLSGLVLTMQGDPYLLFLLY